MAIHEDSILDSIKKLLGLDSDYTPFDTDVMLHINSMFSQLNQLGVGPADGFYIENKETKWEAYFAGAPVDAKLLNSVKSYVYIKVKLLFDPPSTSFGLQALMDQAKEFEWRLNATVDPPVT